MELLGYDRNFEVYHNIDELESAISIYELHEKATYDKLPESERRIRKERLRIIQNIEQRPLIPVISEI